MPVDESLVDRLESAVAAVQAEVDACHAVREAYGRAMESKPPGIGQYRGWVPDCSIPEQELARLKNELDKARRGEPIGPTAEDASQPSGGEAAPTPVDKAEQQLEKDRAAMKAEWARRSIEMSEMQVKMDLTGDAWSASGVALALAGLVPEPASIPGEIIAGGMELTAIGFWVTGSMYQRLGNRYQQMADAL